MKRIVFCQNRPVGRIIFGSVSLLLGLVSLLSAAYGKGESNGFKEGEEVGSEMAKAAIKFFSEEEESGNA